MSSALYFSHAACHEHDPRAYMPGHPERPARLAAIEAALAERDWMGWERREAPAAQEEWLELVHDARLVRNIRGMSLAGGAAIDGDTYVGEASYRAALHAVGGACAMAQALLSREARFGFCGVRPPGHHAEPTRAMGFCLFNNIAIAAAYALRELGARRVFIFDWDVHHGNGTAEAFRHSAEVLFVSIHQQGIYPGSGALSDIGSGPGEGFTLNLPVPAGSEEDLWLSLLEHIALPAAATFKPDLILVSAGFDAHIDDPLAGCSLRTESFARMARQLRDFATTAGAPLGLVLEGGYNIPVLAECVPATLAALTDGIPAESVARHPELHLG
jgi:acetoin utilization deacetylase AcuC-like enzyme